MFTLSRTTSYSIRALAYLAESGEQPQFISGIARAAGVPRAYLAKILPRLKDAEIIGSKRGYTGGVWLARKPESITLLEISNAIDGPDLLAQCILGNKVCSEKTPCAIHYKWKAVRKLVEKELGGVTLSRLADEQASGHLSSITERRSRPGQKKTTHKQKTRATRG